MNMLRQDAAALGTGWNKTLLHYAIAMRELDKEPITNHNSWKFLAAMHGFDRALWIRERLLASGSVVPQELLNGTFANQCQHGSWYFLSWHRAYLFVFEEIVAAQVKKLTGDDWALPYWNYLDSSNPQALDVPEAFLMETLPDGSPNPLKKYPRRQNLRKLQPGQRDAFSLSALEEPDFQVGASGAIGFGGGVTGDFVQFGQWSGGLEINPHNTVHRLVGGDQGYMADPRLAGLDPLFWLHHSNIDRLWEAWMNTPGKNMVRDARWLKGPANRAFVMPVIGGVLQATKFTSRDTLLHGKFYRGYDDLVKGTGLKPGAEAVARVAMGSPNSQSVETIGANGEVIRVGAVPQRTFVDLQAATAAAGVAAMGATIPGEVVSRFYLALESVRGNAPSPLLEVYVNLPADGGPMLAEDRHAASLTLFGLNVASDPDGTHGGNGLSYTIDITELAQRLQAEGDFDPSQLRVTLVPGEQVSDERPITVDRVTVLKRSGTVS